MSLGNKPNEIAGCTLSEIQEICNIQGVKRLPALYEQFLLKMRRRAGYLFGGSEVFYTSLTQSNFKDLAQVMLRKEGVNFPLSEETFVFLWHQNYLSCISIQKI